jgi:hypothetical protein
MQIVLLQGSDFYLIFVKTKLKSLFLDEVKEDVKAIHGIDPTVSVDDLPF